MYSIYDNRNIAALCVIRHGWLKPEYELTNGANIYGWLKYKWVAARRRAFIEIAGKTYSFRYKGFWKTALLIIDNNDEVIGKLDSKPFGRRYTLEMNDGFRAVFRRESFWKSKYVWESETYGPILRIKSPAFSSADDVFVEQSTAPIEMIPLLEFLGIHLLIISRQREAAIAST